MVVQLNLLYGSGLSHYLNAKSMIINQAYWSVLNIKNIKFIKVIEFIRVYKSNKVRVAVLRINYHSKIAAKNAIVMS